jgi:hypothetical protein
MQVYGKTGFVFCKDGTNMQIKEDEKKKLKLSRHPL